MAIRVVTRLLLLLAGLGLATALVVGALSVLASQTPATASPILERDHPVTVERAVEPDEARDTSSTPAVVLVFAGIVILAALPPAHRVYVHHRSHDRSDWY
jgi:hypothetical protein